MCGIVGTIGLISNRNQQKIALERLIPRGPDGLGEYFAPPGEKPVWFGFTRLAIFDLSVRGSQPMSDPSGRFVIVYNGEIYNFVELRKELEGDGIRFLSETDTEVLLQGLIRYGPEFQLRCNGMWAFCLYDRLQGSALLGRDRFGVKPLFWSKVGPGIVFGSEMKALTPFMNSVSPSPEVDQLLRNLFSYESTEKCVIDGIKRLPPGHFAYWRDGSMTLTRWWSTLDHLREVPDAYQDQVAEFRSIFDEAVRLRMRSDVRIGTALSGGLDSSSVLATMNSVSAINTAGSRLASDWQNAYCSSFPGASNDETYWAQQVADELEIPLQKVVTNPADSNWTLRRALWQCEDPYLTPPIAHLETYRAVSQSGVKVTIDGHGADELFSGYGHLASAINFRSIESIKRVLLVERGLNGLGTADAQVDIKELIVAGGAFARKVKWAIGGLSHFVDSSNERFQAMSPLSQKLYEIFHVTILPTLLRNYDRYSMGNGVEIRMPFLDYNLVTYVFSLPDSAKYGSGYSKLILRDAMKGRLSERVRTRRQKIGWNAPVQDWLRGPWSMDIESSGLLGTANSKTLIRLREFRNSTAPTYKQGERIYKQIMPELWRAAVFG